MEIDMDPRMDAFAADPASMQAMLALEAHVQKSGLERSLMELVRMRASQVNGCAYCLHMHSSDARAHGETEARLYLLSAWRESRLYTPRERAALAWTEALTLVADSHAPDEDYAEASRHFTPAELVRLTLLIGAINTWNRIAIGFRSVHPMEGDARAARAG